MRVLYVTSNSSLRSTTSSLNAILRLLRPRGLEPVVVFREPGPWQQELARDGVPTYFDPLRFPEKSRPLRSLRDVWRMARLVRRERVDLIHCNEHEHYLLLRVVGRLTGRPVVATLHWVLGEKWGQWAFAAPYLPATLQFLARAQLEESRPGFPPELPPDRVKLLMSGLFLDEFLARGDDGRSLRRQWGADEDTVVVGTASVIRPRKRLEDFVRLVGRLRKRGRNVLGAIAGGGRFADPEYHRKVQEFIREEGLDRHCLMVGNLDPVTPFYKACDVTLNTADMEILSMSLCEAQACGKPTLAYDVGGNREALPGGWFVAPLGDLDTLEHKLVRLVADPDFRRETGQECERHVRAHFDAPALAERQAAVYEEILGRKLRPAAAAALALSGAGA